MVIGFEVSKLNRLDKDHMTILRLSEERISNEHCASLIAGRILPPYC